jgi:hypothetical protein
MLAEVRLIELWSGGRWKRFENRSTGLDVALEGGGVVAPPSHTTQTDKCR